LLHTFARRDDSCIRLRAYAAEGVPRRRYIEDAQKVLNIARDGETLRQRSAAGRRPPREDGMPMSTRSRMFSVDVRLPCPAAPPLSPCRHARPTRQMFTSTSPRARGTTSPACRRSRRDTRVGFATYVSGANPSCRPAHVVARRAEVTIEASHARRARSSIIRFILPNNIRYGRLPVFEIGRGGDGVCDALARSSCQRNGEAYRWQMSAAAQTAFNRNSRLAAVDEVMICQSRRRVDGWQASPMRGASARTRYAMSTRIFRSGGG